MLSVIKRQTPEDGTLTASLARTKITPLNLSLGPASSGDITHLALAAGGILALTFSSSFVGPVNLRGI